MVLGDGLQTVGDREFVEAGRALGGRERRLLRRHILPNALSPIVVAVTFGIKNRTDGNVQVAVDAIQAAAEKVGGVRNAAPRPLARFDRGGAP